MSAVTRLRAVQRWARLRRHNIAVRRARYALDQLRGEAFMAARDHYLELLLCPDAEHCDHVQ